MSFRSPLGRVRGLGSAKDGTHHFWIQRLTALALIPLITWLGVALAGLAGAPHETVINWLSLPLNTGMMLLLVFVGFYHAKLGVQVVIEDYVHTEWIKLASQIFLTFVTVTAGLTAALAVLGIFVGS